MTFCVILAKLVPDYDRGTGIQYHHDVFSLPSGFPVKLGMTSIVIPAASVIPVKLVPDYDRGTGIQHFRDVFSLPSGFPVKLGMTSLEGRQ